MTAEQLAVKILMEAVLDDDSENGFIQVNPDELFRFYVLHNLAKAEAK
jgi:hypothetical protein